MKTPLTYYGGKQKLSKKILSLIPEHTLYAEPFVGGGAVFFAKQPSKLEVLNDVNNELINFYKVVQTNYAELEKEIKATLHSRELHRQASIVYNKPELFSDVKRAWAIWVQLKQSYCSMIGDAFGFDKTVVRLTKSVNNNRDNFTIEFSKRLENVCLESKEANFIIQSRDTESTFFYLDPPYFNSRCTYSQAYTENDYRGLLELLSTIKGKFLLSSYPSDILDKYIEDNKWNQIATESLVSIDNKPGRQKKKIELLVANYII